MTTQAIQLPGRTVPGSIADVSQLTFSDESVTAWRDALSAIVEAERSVDDNAELISIH